MKYLIRPGDCVESVAARYGVSVDELLGLGDNERLRAGDNRPGIVRAGDRIDVPEEPERSASFTPGGRQRYCVEIPTTTLRMRLVDGMGAPAARKKYEVVVASITIAGQTDADGVLEEAVPVLETEARLHLWLDEAQREPYEVPVHIGAVDPVEEESGAIHRLSNLGFSGAEGGAEPLRGAVEAFQRSIGLPVTGAIDDETRRRLREEHGS